jgi:hypothetical protein
MSNVKFSPEAGYKQQDAPLCKSKEKIQKLEDRGRGIRISAAALCRRGRQWLLSMNGDGIWGRGRKARRLQAEGTYKLRRRAAATFRSTKPSGRMEARSLRRIVPVKRFHMRIKRRSKCLAAERDFLCELY